MKPSATILLGTLGLLVASVIPACASVHLTALQIHSTDANGKIPGVGGHRFKTTNHGGQPCIYVIDGDDLNGQIMNGPGPAQNSIDLLLSTGSHTYTVYAENSNAYTWANYTIEFHFDSSMNAQISALAPMNTSSTIFFPAFTANKEYTEDLAGHAVLAPNSLVYKSGETEVKLTAFHFSTPTLFNMDRISPSDVESDGKLDYVGQFTLQVTAPPVVNPGGVVNGGSYSAKIAPGSLFSIFGSDLSTTTKGASTVPLPQELSGTSVTVGGRPAPLMFVSAGQINAQLPYEMAESPDVPVVVTVNGRASAPVTMNVVAAAPGIFQFGQKRALVQNQDYSINNVDNGAAAGSYVVVYGTGTGRVDNPVATGGVAGSDPLSRPLANVTATVDGLNAEVVFAGLSPGFVGLTQVNLKLPNLAPGNYPVVINVNGEDSNSALITVK
jgi:uncharacterized protein (TIGR03437 family)